MIVANPFWRYPIALAKPTIEVTPLIDAIKRLDVRPFRIISHEREDGKVIASAPIPKALFITVVCLSSHF